MAKIIAIGTANPERKLTQADAWQELNRLRNDLTPLEKKFYKRFMLDDGIHTRYLALPELKDIFCSDQDEIIKRYNKFAPEIAAKASVNALNSSKLGKEKIGFVSTASCTGYLCPGLSSYVIEKVGLNQKISACDIQGMGCGAAVPALSSAVNYLAGEKINSYGLINCTELCSASIVWESDLGLILSNSIFGDGSATAVLTNDPAASGPEILDYASVIFPEHRDELRFKIYQGKLRNQLSPAVPEIAARGVADVVGQLLNRNNLDQKAIRFWALHSGGRKVLETISAKLDLTEDQLSYSRETLRDYGNMSSPTVLFALNKIMASGSPQKGDYGLLIAFGAGFSCYGALLKW